MFNVDEKILVNYLKSLVNDENRVGSYLQFYI
jgi:hypothetical protein